MTLARRSAVQGFGRTFHSTTPHLDMKDARFRREMADIPAATRTQMGTHRKCDAIRRHYNARIRRIGRIYNQMSRQLETERNTNHIADETYWAKDDALWAKVQGMSAQCEARRNARVAEIQAAAKEAIQS